MPTGSPGSTEVRSISTLPRPTRPCATGLVDLRVAASPHKQAGSAACCARRTGRQPASWARTTSIGMLAARARRMMMRSHCTTSPEPLPAAASHRAAMQSTRKRRAAQEKDRVPAAPPGRVRARAASLSAGRALMGLRSPSSKVIDGALQGAAIVEASRMFRASAWAASISAAAIGCASGEGSIESPVPVRTRRGMNAAWLAVCWLPSARAAAGARGEIEYAPQHLDEHARQRQIRPIGIGGDVEKHDQALAAPLGGDQGRAVGEACPDLGRQIGSGLSQHLAVHPDRCVEGQAGKGT